MSFAPHTFAFYLIDILTLMNDLLFQFILLQNQWISYGGLCGTCGDPFQQRPRENEAGGKYASGLITRLYKSGEVIPIKIDLTANHGGYFEFRLCPVDNRHVRATNECFDQYPLAIVNQLQPGIKYWIQDRGMQGHMTLEVKLPPLLSCKHCVLQWRWWTGKHTSFALTYRCINRYISLRNFAHSNMCTKLSSTVKK